MVWPKAAREKTTFKKGNPGGPGRPKLPEELRQISPLPKDSYKKIISKIMQMSFVEFQQYIETIKERSVLEAYIATTIADGIKKKDHNKIEWLAQRTVGKVKDEVEMEVTNNVHEQILKYIKERANE